MIPLRFSSSRRTYSKIIKFLTWSDYTHVETVMPNGDLVGSITGAGVGVYGNISRERRGSYRYLSIEVDKDLYYNFIREQIGKPYDWGGVFGFLLRTEKWNSPNKWFCSELCAAAIQKSCKSGHLFGDGYDRITPGNLFQWTIPASRESIISGLHT